MLNPACEYPTCFGCVYAHLFRDEGCEAVVIAEHAVELVAFIARDGIVLIQDGHHSELQHGGGGVPQVSTPFRRAEVELRHQELLSKKKRI